MKFLVDRCAGRRLAEWLSSEGHDVLKSSDLGADPGDVALCRLAHEQRRVLVTIDTDFGRHVFLHDEPHCGLLRLPDVPAEERIRLTESVLGFYSAALLEGAVVTVRGKKIRVSRRPQGATAPR